MRRRVAKVTADAKLVRLEADLFPRIGSKPISDLNAPALLKVLLAIEGRGANEIARRVRQMLGQIFRYAISTGRVSINPAADLAGAQPPANPVHHAAIPDPKAVGAYARDSGLQGRTHHTRGPALRPTRVCAAGRNADC